MMVKKQLLINVISALLCMVAVPALGMNAVAKDQADAKKKEADKKLALEKVIQAIKNKDLAGVQKYIDEDGDVDASASYCKPLLDRCADYDNIQAARLLIAKGANINLCAGVTLQTASEKRNQEFVTFLLDNGADTEQRQWNRTHLMLVLENACYCSDAQRKSRYLDIAILLMQRGADVNALQGSEWRCQDRPALLKIVNPSPYGLGLPDWDNGIYNRLNIIKTLLRWGADFTSEEIQEELSASLRDRLDYALQKKNEQERRAIEELEKYIKEFPALWNKTAITECLHHLNVSQNPKVKTDLEGIITAFLDESPTLESKLYRAIYDGNRAVIEGALRCLPNFLKARDALGYTPLLSLVYRCSAALEIAINVFCEAGADIDVQTHDGQTTSMIADRQLKAAEDEATGERYKAVKNTLNHHRAKREEVKLAKLKADEEQAKKEDADALIEFDRLKRAISDNDVNVLSNCSESMLEKKGSTLLLHAAKLGRTPIVEKLLAQKVPVDKRDEGYHTALMVAAINGNIETVAVLLKHMAPEHIKMTLHGKTAYELAQEAAARLEERFKNQALPEYEQGLEKYKQIMIMLKPS